MSQEIVVGSEPSRPQRVSSGSLPVVTHDDFLRVLDENGKAVFGKVLEFAQSRAMPIHWGTKGFSLNVDLDGTHVAVFFCYPPASVYKQSIYTTLMGRGGMSTKTAVPEEEVKIKEIEEIVEETEPVEGEAKPAKKGRTKVAEDKLKARKK